MGIKNRLLGIRLSPETYEQLCELAMTLGKQPERLAAEYLEGVILNDYVSMNEVKAIREAKPEGRDRWGVEAPAHCEHTIIQFTATGLQCMACGVGMVHELFEDSRGELTVGGLVPKSDTEGG